LKFGSVDSDLITVQRNLHLVYLFC